MGSNLMFLSLNSDGHVGNGIKMSIINRSNFLHAHINLEDVSILHIRKENL